MNKKDTFDEFWKLTSAAMLIAGGDKYSFDEFYNPEPGHIKWAFKQSAESAWKAMEAIRL